MPFLVPGDTQDTVDCSFPACSLVVAVFRPVLLGDLDR